MYVDNIIVASLTQEAVALLSDLEKDFALKDIDDLNDFLGIQVQRSKRGVLLSQERCVSDILQRANMMTCKPIQTPLATSEKLSKTDGEPLGVEDFT